MNEATEATEATETETTPAAEAEVKADEGATAEPAAE